MKLSNDLVSQFAKLIKNSDENNQNGIMVEGTAVEYNKKMYVRLDGSDQLTPIISSTAGMKNGDRVTVLIKDHKTTVTGNTSSPSVSGQELEDAKTEIGDKITEVEILIADKVSAKELEVEKGRIDDLVTDNILVKEKLTATEAEIGKLTAKDVEITGKLEAVEGEIENLDTKFLTAEVADIKYAKIGDLEATNADIHNLKADYGEFKCLTTDKFIANDAEIGRLDTEKLSTKEAELKFANIDFANIGKAAIENFFSKSGMIGDLVVGEGTVTGTLVGVTIKGDLIEGGTVVADKLVIKGEDGIYYKLNTTGETVGAEQTEYNSLNGSVITAKSITAEKISVHDLVAFGATIGGFHITEDAIYSGVKDSVDNTTRGTYMDDTGQFAIGDSNNYLKFFKDVDGNWKLAISARSIVLSSSGKDLEELAGDAIVSSTEEFYKSNSPIVLEGGSWSEKQPEWEDGKYIWRRTAIVRGDGSSEYTPDQNGVCITGNTGSDGKDGEDAVTLQILSSNGNIFKNSSISTSLTVTIIVSGKMITSSDRMRQKFGDNATITWEQKRFGQDDFEVIDPTDSRLSDNGFILTLDPRDVFTHTVFNCALNY